MMSTCAGQSPLWWTCQVGDLSLLPAVWRSSLTGDGSDMSAHLQARHHRSSCYRLAKTATSGFWIGKTSVALAANCS